MPANGGLSPLEYALDGRDPADGILKTKCG
jgi:hypothetical protein